MSQFDTAEHRRLAEHDARTVDWKHWGPYVAERAWGTVREDYSENGDAWGYFTHDQARSRAYRWNEDGLGGFCNRYQNVCFALGLWNGQDPILKERLFGLTGSEGNHGEDCKEYYFYLDGTPTHSYMRMLYKYPHTAYPYAKLIEANKGRSRELPEVELVDLIGDQLSAGRYFDVIIEYAKADADDVLCRITAINRGPDAATLHLLPQVWFRNTWSWGYNSQRPQMKALGESALELEHRHLGKRFVYFRGDGKPKLLFTENDTNRKRVFGQENPMPYVKDAFHEAIVGGKLETLNPALKGTKAAAQFQTRIPPGGKYVVQFRCTQDKRTDPFANFDRVFEDRIRDADEYYAALQEPGLTDDERLVQRQAAAGLLWSKQFYHYSVELWLDGDPTGAHLPHRAAGRNAGWRHMYNLDIISMPDKWEYPWYAAWDLAFHCLPLASLDPAFAKRQLMLMLREWYMHPNGQLPAYEWNFSDVNPPVHAWACWRVYKIDRNITGRADVQWLEEVFQKLLLNFTWWVNRKDRGGQNVFEGGFLGLDNIGVFDRNQSFLDGGYIEQADGTAWMGMFCLNMLAISLELARTRPAYESIATKFLEHFIYIAHAINAPLDEGGLWDPDDGFFYDKLHEGSGATVPLKIRSLVGLIPLLAVETLEPDLLERMPNFRRRMEWFIQYRPKLTASVASLTEPGDGNRRLLTIVDRYKLERILPRMFDPAQFLSQFGLRSMSRQLKNEPFILHCDGQEHRVAYEPGESTASMFGGNSNWRGPIWFPINYLMVEALQKYHHYYGDALTTEFPRYAGNALTLDKAAAELGRRLCSIFLRELPPATGPVPSTVGTRPVFGNVAMFNQSEHWRDYVPFYEYFHGDNGRGLGASHQTGWTALVTRLLHVQAQMKSSSTDRDPRTSW